MNEADAKVSSVEATEPGNSASVIAMIEHAQNQALDEVNKRRTHSDDLVALAGSVPPLIAEFASLQPTFAERLPEVPEFFFENYNQLLFNINKVAHAAKQEATDGNLVGAVAMATFIHRVVEPGRGLISANKDMLLNYIHVLLLTQMRAIVAIHLAAATAAAEAAAAAAPANAENDNANIQNGQEEEAD